MPLSTVAAGVGIALGTGSLAGVVNGALIARAKITPILATIGSGQMFVGLSLVLTGGPAVVGFPEPWYAIGNGKLLGVAFPLVLFVAVAVALALSRTPLGIDLFLIGGNAKAATFAGIRVERAIFLSYVATGVLASVAGILLWGARTRRSRITARPIWLRRC